MENRQLFMRRTDKKGGVTITDHWCWDAQRFIDTRMEEARKEGGKVDCLPATSTGLRSGRNIGVHDGNEAESRNLRLLRQDRAG